MERAQARRRFAQHSAEASGTSRDLIYIATATADNAEMSQSLCIEKHQQQHNDRWTLEEELLYLANAIRRHDNQRAIILVDCPILWLKQLFASILLAIRARALI